MVLTKGCPCVFCSLCLILIIFTKRVEPHCVRYQFFFLSYSSPALLAEHTVLTFLSAIGVSATLKLVLTRIIHKHLSELI